MSSTSWTYCVLLFLHPHPHGDFMVTRQCSQPLLSLLYPDRKSRKARRRKGRACLLLTSAAAAREEEPVPHRYVKFLKACPDSGIRSAVSFKLFHVLCSFNAVQLKTLYSCLMWLISPAHVWIFILLTYFLSGSSIKTTVFQMLSLLWTLLSFSSCSQWEAVSDKCVLTVVQGLWECPCLFHQPRSPPGGD